MSMEIRQILVRMPNWIGDLVMATPILTDLQKAYPNASITAMCSSPGCELLKEDEAINELFCFRKSRNFFLKREQRKDILSKIQSGKFDLGVLLTNSFSSAWLFCQGKVKRRVGYTGDFRRALLTDPIYPQKKKTHQIDRYKEILTPLGIAPTDTMPRLFVQDLEVENAKELLFQRGYEKGAPLIGVCPFAAYGPAKSWPLDRFKKLICKLSQEGYFVAVFGDPSTEGLAKDLCRGHCEKVINLAGLTTIRELACLVKVCSAIVTNDSGPMHIASAFNVPLVALFGSTDESATGPYGKNGIVINKKVECSPCFKRECPIDFRCMKQISTDEVFSKLQEFVKKDVSNN